MPFFFVFFSGLDMYFHTWSAGPKDKINYMSHVEYIYSGFNPLPIESIHINGKNDMFYMFNNEYLRFDYPE